MGLIDIVFDLIQDLTVVTATGKLKADDFQKSIEEYYSGPVTAHILLDLNQADLSAFQSHDLIRIAGLSKQGYSFSAMNGLKGKIQQLPFFVSYMKVVVLVWLVSVFTNVSSMVAIS